MATLIYPMSTITGAATTDIAAITRTGITTAIITDTVISAIIAVTMITTFQSMTDITGSTVVMMITDGPIASTKNIATMINIHATTKITAVVIIPRSTGLTGADSPERNPIHLS